MRLFLLALTTGVILGGCAPYVQTESANTPAGAAGAGASGRGPQTGPPISPAARALLEQGSAQHRAGEFAQASESLERALRIAPEQPAIWLELGRLRLAEGDSAQAEQMGRKALSLAPANSETGSQASQLIDAAQREQTG